MAVLAEVPPVRGKNLFAIVLAVALSVLILVDVGMEQGIRKGALFCVGLALGITLYASSFGFAGSWRAFL